MECGTMAISQLQIKVTVLRVSVKWTRKLKTIQKVPPLKKNSKILITSQNSTSVRGVQVNCESCELLVTASCELYVGEGGSGHQASATENT